jgi:hypothetical protein
MIADDQRADRLARTFMTGHVNRRELLRRAGLFGGAALAAGTWGPLLAAARPPPTRRPTRQSHRAARPASQSAAVRSPRG